MTNYQTYPLKKNEKNLNQNPVIIILNQKKRKSYCKIFKNHTNHENEALIAKKQIRKRLLINKIKKIEGDKYQFIKKNQGLEF